MLNLGIDLSDAGVMAAAAAGGECRLLAAATGAAGPARWPGFAYHDGTKLVYGSEAEDHWFVHPRRVVNNFLARLTHDPVTLNMPGKPPSHSELAYHFLKAFLASLGKPAGSARQVVLAVPGSYLKDEATEEERIGLLLGIAQELKLPLATIVDLACAVLCDPRAPAINPALPVLLVDVELQSADLSLLVADRQFVRQARVEVPHAGLAQLLKQVTAAMGNRFLRHTTFDILEDGRIEQLFYRQTKDFMVSGPAEFRYYINTAKRAYEMPGKNEQLVVDAQPFVRTIEGALQSFARAQNVVPDACTVVLTDRAAMVPGLEARLHVAGYRRVVRMPAGAAACGAARMAETRPAPPDLASVPVESAVPFSELNRATEVSWQAHLHKARSGTPGLVPTHVVLAGVGHVIGGNGTFTVGTAGAGADLVLPAPFDREGNGAVSLVREDGRLWFREPAAGKTPAALAAVEAGDRLAVRCNDLSVDLLFIHCLPPGADGHA